MADYLLLNGTLRRSSSKKLSSKVTWEGRLSSPEGRSEGDPRKIADAIVQLANSDEVPIRLILGVDASARGRTPDVSG